MILRVFWSGVPERVGKRGSHHSTFLPPYCHCFLNFSYLFLEKYMCSYGVFHEEWKNESGVSQFIQLVRGTPELPSKFIVWIFRCCSQVRPFPLTAHGEKEANRFRSLMWMAVFTGNPHLSSCQ